MGDLILTSFMRKIWFLPIVQMKEWVSICKEIALNHPANKQVIWDLNQCPCDSKVPACPAVASAEQAQLLDLWRNSHPVSGGNSERELRLMVGLLVPNGSCHLLCPAYWVGPAHSLESQGLRKPGWRREWWFLTFFTARSLKAFEVLSGHTLWDACYSLT